ncbi:hypothetical protein EMM73_16975 [Rheinheimera sediminis]|uniref:hypothetical protein n=1 Tax=Rheinheimera sp. YQF-1 TaxID=2499626 RepID=UPI000FDB8370|nr:hypothetical protein [Rheinheimera sp. YQF-1]RVT44210.1 hypothetical protein EMM73_16975 [Rheinheimera sp. YQF-1]
MNQSLKCLSVLIVATVVAACSGKAKEQVNLQALQDNIENLSTLAALCLEQKARGSEPCLSFVRQYEADGADQIKRVSDHLPEFLEKDLDAALVTTEQVLVITNAVLFMAE